MFVHYRTQGFILKKEDRGEADQLFTVFAKNFGKLEIFGRAIRKITSKLKSASSSFYLSEIEFIQGKIHRTLTDAILIDNFKHIRECLERLNLAYQIAEVTDSFLGKEQRDEKIWQLLLGAFKKLNDLKLEIGNSKLEILYYYFLWNFFSTLGYTPQLYSCSVCERKLLPEAFWYLSEEGGVVCWRCFKNFGEEKKKQAQEIDVETVKVLRIFLTEDWGILDKLKIKEKTQGNLKDVTDSYLSFLKGEFSKMEK